MRDTIGVSDCEYLGRRYLFANVDGKAYAFAGCHEGCDAIMHGANEALNPKSIDDVIAMGYPVIAVMRPEMHPSRPSDNAHAMLGYDFMAPGNVRALSAGHDDYYLEKDANSGIGFDRVSRNLHAAGYRTLVRYNKANYWVKVDSVRDGTVTFRSIKGYSTIFDDYALREIAACVGEWLIPTCRIYGYEYCDVGLDCRFSKKLIDKHVRDSLRMDIVL